VSSLYRHVIDDTLKQAREHILVGMEEGEVDYIIDRLLSLWENKLSLMQVEATKPAIPSAMNHEAVPSVSAVPEMGPLPTHYAPSPYLPMPQPNSAFGSVGPVGSIARVPVINPYESVMPSLETPSARKPVADIPTGIPISAKSSAVAQPQNGSGQSLGPQVVVPVPTRGAIDPSSQKGLSKAPEQTSGKKANVPAKRPAAGSSFSPVAKKSKSVRPQKTMVRRDGDDDLDDISLSGSELGSEYDDDDVEPETDNLGICLWAKVKRIKNHWTCTLREGVVRVNGKDLVFRECAGDFTF